MQKETTKETISFRSDSSKIRALDEISKVMDRDRTYIINQAIDSYLDFYNWQIAKINEGISQIEAGETVSEEDMDKIYKKFDQ
jgi:predicted transcriptional regulator